LIPTRGISYSAITTNDDDQITLLSHLISAESLVEGCNDEKDRFSIENTFDALLGFYQVLSEEESRAVRENLNNETLVLFDLLKKPELKKKELERIKRVAVVSCCRP